MQNLLKFTVFAALLSACGSGDGPATSVSTHPTLGTCDRYQSSRLATCTEYRNITDADWTALASTCNDDSTVTRSYFTEDDTCSTAGNQGACRTVTASGMTITAWYFNDAALPSKIASDCQVGGGTYVPQDEAG